MIARVVTLVSVLAATLIWMAAPAAAAGPVEATGPASPVAEGDPGAAGTATFTLEYPGTLLPGQTYPVSYYTFTEPDDAAVAGADYVHTTGSHTFTAISKSTTVAVPLVGDDVIEAAESFSLYVSGENGSTIARATIHDDDAATIDGAAARTVAESDAKVDLTLRYQGQDLTGQDATFHVTTVDGSATAAEDYTKPPTAFTFANAKNGDTKTLSIPIVADTAPEPAETFTVELRSSASAGTVLASVTVTIAAHGTPPTVWVDDVSVTEGNPPLPTTAVTVTVKRSAATSLPTKVRLDTLAPTSGHVATAGADYTAVANRVVTIPAGESQVTTDIDIARDALDEFDETFLVVPSNPTNAVLRSSPTPRGTVTIVDDDAPSVVSVVSDGAVTEPDAGATAVQRFTVALDKASGKTVTADYFTEDGNAKAGLDYVAASGRVTFAPGETSKKVDITVIGDDIYEFNELYYVHLDDPQTTDPAAPPLNADWNGVPAEATITDNETIAISVADATGTETSREVIFTVSLNRATDVHISADYATASGTGTDKAESGADFTATSGTVTIIPGATSATVKVPVTDDLLEELSPERFTLTLSNPKPTGARQPTIARAVGTGHIVDNDESLRVNDVSVAEGAGTATFTVTLSAPVTEDVQFDVTTADVTAVAGRDYTATTVEGLTILAGSTTAQFSVPILDDSIRESAETFKVTLSNVAPTTIGTGIGISIADGVGIGTIVDDDPIGIAIADRSMAEGTSPSSTNFTFAVTLDRTHSDTITVPWATRFGTAKSGDLAAASGSVVFTPGETVKSISIPVTADSFGEPDEQFFVDLTPPAGVNASKGTGTGTILDDDGGVPVISVANASVAEGQSGTKTMQFAVTVDPPNFQSISFEYATAADAGEAVAGEDYVAKSGTVTIPAGPSPSATISITVNGDTMFEDDETFSLVFSNADNARMASPSARGTITNDDTLPVVTIGDGSIAEGDSGTTILALPLALSNASEDPVQVRATSAEGTATVGVDYDAVTGTITIPAKALNGTVPVTVRGDTTAEDDETLTVTLSAPVGATLGTPEVATATIVNDDFRSPNERFVEWLLVHFLRRDVGPGDPLVAQYVAQLEDGASRKDVATAVAFSDEYLGAVVEFIYDQALGRKPDSNGRATWIRELRNGATPAELAARIFASTENFQKAGGTNEAWIDGLYRVLLLREADDTGRRNWVAATEANGRRYVAARFYASVESRQTRVKALYQLLLGRDPDASGLKTWTTVLKNGRDVDLAIELAKSKEYFDRAQRLDARDA